MQSLLGYESEEDEEDEVSPPPLPPPQPPSAAAAAPAPALAPPPITREEDGCAEVVKEVGLEASSLPPVVNAGVSEEVLKRVGQYLDAQRQFSFDLTESIQSKKDFGNPEILTKVVDHFKIFEYGSNYPPVLFNPRAVLARNEPNPTPAPVPIPIPALPPGTASIQFVSSSSLSGAEQQQKDGGEQKRKKSRWE